MPSTAAVRSSKKSDGSSSVGILMQGSDPRMGESKGLVSFRGCLQSNTTRTSRLGCSHPSACGVLWFLRRAGREQRNQFSCLASSAYCRRTIVSEKSGMELVDSLQHSSGLIDLLCRPYLGGNLLARCKGGELRVNILEQLAHPVRRE